MALGEISIDLVAEISEWKSGLGDASAAVERFEKDTSAQLDLVNKKLAGLSAKEAAGAFRELSDLVSGFSEGAQGAAAAADDLADGLRGAFGDQADSVAQFVQSMGTAKGVLEDGALAKAAQNLQKQGIYTEQTLKRVADAAVFTGGSVDGLAESYGRFNKFATDSKSALGLQKAIGASGQDLEKFGAFLDANNKLLVDTPLRLEAARQALIAFGDEKFGGSLDRVSDDSAKLQGELKLLQQDIGTAGHNLREELAPAALVAVQALRELPDGAKAFIGLGADFISTGGKMAASVVEVGANLKLLTGGMNVAGGATKALTLAKQGLSGATTLLLSPLGLAIVAIGALALGFAAYTQEINNSTKAQEDLLKIEEKRLKAYREGNELIGKSAAELQKLGVTSQKYSLVLQGLQDAADEAGNQGNKALESRLEKQVQDGRKVLKDLEKAEADKRGGASGTAGQALAPAADEAGAKKPSAGNQAPGRKPPDENDKEKAAREKKEAKDKEDARKEALDAALAAIDQEDARHALSTAQKLKRYKDLLEANRASLLPEERRNIEGKIAALEGKSLDERTKAKEDARKRSYQAELDSITRLAAVRDLDKAGQIRALDELLQRRKANNSITLDEERNLLGQIANLRGQAADEEKAKAKKDADDKKKQADKNAADLQKARDEGRGLARDAVSDRIGDLQDRRSQGAPVGHAIEEAIKERLRLQEEDIKAEAAAAAKATDSEEARAQIVANANEKIAAARRDATKALTEELNAQDALKAKKAGVESQGPRAFENRAGTIQDFGQVQQDLTDQFGIDATRARIQEQVARNRAQSAGTPGIDRNAIKAAGAIGTAPKIDNLGDLATEIGKALQQPTTVILEVKEGGRTTRTEQSNRPGEPASFNHRMGGVTG